jgi:hypothetical protein
MFDYFGHYHGLSPDEVVEVRQDFFARVLAGRVLRFDGRVSLDKYLKYLLYEEFYHYSHPKHAFEGHTVYHWDPVSETECSVELSSFERVLVGVSGMGDGRKFRGRNMYLEVFRLLRAGYIGREIADELKCTGMYVSLI